MKEEDKKKWNNYSQNEARILLEKYVWDYL